MKQSTEPGTPNAVQRSPVCVRRVGTAQYAAELPVPLWNPAMSLHAAWLATNSISQEYT
ncbi:MAG: hypothetical protein ABI304_13635 [Rudaea sp.]